MYIISCELLVCCLGLDHGGCDLFGTQHHKDRAEQRSEVRCIGWGLGDFIYFCGQGHCVEVRTCTQHHTALFDICSWTHHWLIYILILVGCFFQFKFKSEVSQHHIMQAHPFGSSQGHDEAVLRWVGKVPIKNGSRGPHLVSIFRS